MRGAPPWVARLALSSASVRFVESLAVELLSSSPAPKTRSLTSAFCPPLESSTCMALLVELSASLLAPALSASWPLLAGSSPGKYCSRRTGHQTGASYQPWCLHDVLVLTWPGRKPSKKPSRTAPDASRAPHRPCFLAECSTPSGQLAHRLETADIRCCSDYEHCSEGIVERLW